MSWAEMLFTSKLDSFLKSFMNVAVRYLGMEPSGRKFNDMELDYNKQPHNPMVGNKSILHTFCHRKMFAISFFSFNFK